MPKAVQPVEERYLLSVREAAQRLGVARRTLEREVCRKKFPPPLKIGAKSLYLVSDIERYVASLTAQREAKLEGTLL